MAWALVLVWISSRTTRFSPCHCEEAAGRRGNPEGLGAAHLIQLGKTPDQEGTVCSAFGDRVAALAMTRGRARDDRGLAGAGGEGLAG